MCLCYGAGDNKNTVQNNQLSRPFIGYGCVCCIAFQIFHTITHNIGHVYNRTINFNLMCHRENRQIVRWWLSMERLSLSFPFLTATKTITHLWPIAISSMPWKYPINVGFSMIFKLMEDILQFRINNIRPVFILIQIKTQQQQQQQQCIAQTTSECLLIHENLYNIVNSVKQYLFEIFVF